MAPVDNTETVCLGVAIDHRIRRLLKPVPPPPANSQPSLGLHLPILDDRGRELGRSDAEISVTRTLAGPATRGGIAVALQQPRHNHPFNKGLDAVIADCSTLAGLDELFLAASCRTLSIRTNVSVIDLMPYIPEQRMKDMTDDQLRNSFDLASRAFCHKKPEVVLCAGKINPPRPQFRDTRKGETFKVESCGIGRVFGDTPKNPDNVRLVGDIGEGRRSLIPIHKVNGFHLSYALNYRSHYSCLRQLQLLTVAEACRSLSGGWQEDTWMKSIRDACATVVEMTNTSPRKGETSAPKPRSLYLPDYEKLYSTNLRTMRDLLVSRLASPESGLYDTLLEAGLSELCNDTVLILREMAKLKAKGWEARFNKWNTDTLRKAEKSTLDFAQRPRDLSQSLDDPRLRSVVYKALVSVGETVGKDGLDLIKAASTFLDFAVDLEKLLLDLLEQESVVKIEASDAGLASVMDSLNLAAKKEPVVKVRPVRRS